MENKTQISDYKRAREEHDREMRELRQMMNNHFMHLEEDRKKDREEREQWKKERDAYEYAKQQGILIIHVIDESVFTLDPVPDKSVLRRF